MFAIYFAGHTIQINDFNNPFLTRDKKWAESIIFGEWIWVETSLQVKMPVENQLRTDGVRKSQNTERTSWYTVLT